MVAERDMVIELNDGNRPVAELIRLENSQKTFFPSV